METAREQAVELARRLRGAGFVAWFAGGCVRDRLLGREPKDYDIATDARPEQVAGLFAGARLVGAHFGVVIVPRNGIEHEIATFRSDGEYHDGRHPEGVVFSTAEEDAQRRDFTINGLFEDPETGEIIDHVGGRADLEKRVLRAIGDPDKRFAEDHLRLLRAVRFATELDGFEIEPATWEALRRHAPSIARIAPERVRAELSRIFVHPRRVHGFDLLADSGLLGVVLPEMLDLQGCDQPPQFHPEGDVWVHTRIMLGLLAPDAPVELVWAVLLHDIAKPATRTIDETGRIRFNGHDRLGAEMTESILRRLRFPNDTIEPVTEMVRQHMNYMHVQDMRVAKLKRFMARPTFPIELELHRVDCASSNGLMDNYDFLRAKMEEFSAAPLVPPRLVDGRDIMALGIPSGPEVGRWLGEIQTLQLEGKLADREAALEWLRENAPPPRRSP
jgi:poly(A) polymerase